MCPSSILGGEIFLGENRRILNWPSPRSEPIALLGHDYGWGDSNFFEILPKITSGSLWSVSFVGVRSDLDGKGICQEYVRVVVLNY